MLDKLNRLKNLQPETSDLLFASFCSLAIIILQVINVQTSVPGSPVHTLFGDSVAGFYPATLEILLIIALQRRLGSFLAFGVLAGAFAFSFVVNPPIGLILATIISKVAVVVLVGVLFHRIEKDVGLVWAWVIVGSLALTVDCSVFKFISPVPIDLHHCSFERILWASSIGLILAGGSNLYKKVMNNG